MKKLISLFVRLLALTLILFVLFAIAATILGPEVEQQPAEQQAGALILLVVCFIEVLVTAFVIRNSVWSGWHLSGAVFLFTFGVMSFMSQIEAAVFPTQLPPGMVWRLFGMGIAITAPFSLIAVMLLGGWTRPPSDREGTVVRFGTAGWAWRVGAIIAAYVFLYFSFGYFIAWQSAAVREYYGGADPEGFLTHMRGLLSSAPWLIPFQVLRAVIWAAIGWVIVRVTGSRKIVSALAVALTFSVLMNAQLLLPNPFMPEAVRMAHLLETATSNFLFGLIVGFVFTLRGPASVDFGVTGET